MRLLYLAPANSTHTFRWLNHFQKHHDVLLISSEKSQFSYDLQVTLSDYSHAPDRGLLRYWLSVKEAIKWFAPDLIHVHYLNKWALLPPFLNRPYILTPWGSDLLQHLPQHHSGFKALMHRSMRGASAIISDTRSLLDYCENQGAKDLFHVPFGVDASWLTLSVNRAEKRHQLGFKPHHKVILSSRALTPFYRLHDMINALKQLLKEDEAYRMLVLNFNADKGYLAQVKQQLQAFGLEQKVFFHTAKSRAELPSIYKAADVLVSAATTDGVPATFFEAMAMQLPVVTVDHNAYHDFFESGKHLLNCQSSLSDLGSVIKALFESPEKVRYLKKHGHELSGREVFENKMSEVESIYQEIVA